MKKIAVKTRYKKLLADMQTPVGIYYRLRDRFSHSILMESSDYNGEQNSMSYICFHPIAGFKLVAGVLELQLPNGKRELQPVSENDLVVDLFQEFLECFTVEQELGEVAHCGVFGHTSFEAVRHFEDIEFTELDVIPEMHYQFFSFVIAIDHFKDELYIIEHQVEGLANEYAIDDILTLINNRNYSQQDFALDGEETSNYSDEEFLQIVRRGKEHCQRGDVFQVVFSRHFKRPFAGDEFNVYRALRSINPSPYLFYFDYGDYRVFGSSPEAQLVIKDTTASLFPIAGTYKRTGDSKNDSLLAKKLASDTKENAEHVMLLDLARNDLTKHAQGVAVEINQEIQYYSHVMHMVSKVTGTIAAQTSAIRMAADTFPAGTLSGAPKYRALELIRDYENQPRGFYGGAIGFLGFNGDYNHAIMIRSFMSRNNSLHYQAGAGIVAKSSPDSELAEVDNKLSALRQALEVASELNERR